MSLTNTENLRDEIDKLYRYYADGVKIRTKCNLNDAAVNSENFFRHFFNLLYSFDLSKDRIESAYNETIDLHNLEKKICVQVTARNDKAKVDKTVEYFIQKKKYEQYKELHFIIIDRERTFQYDKQKLENHGVKICFHDYTTIFQTLKDQFDSYDKIRPIWEFIQNELSTTPSIIHRDSLEIEILDKEDFSTDDHIVDQILKSLKRFDGFSVIYPRTIAKLPVFNSESSYYNSYSHYCLKTDNISIHELLQNIVVNDHSLTINEDTLKPFEEKIMQIFTILNRSLITCICYRDGSTEIKHHKIDITAYDPGCNCKECQYSNFNIKELFPYLKGKAVNPSVNSADALEEGYYLCKLGEHIKGWQVLNSITQKSTDYVSEFLTLYNIKKIRWFINSYWWQDESQYILPKTDCIDLHQALSKPGIPIRLRNELIKVKEDYFLHYSREIIDDLFNKVLSTHQLYSRGGSSSGNTAATLLEEELHILYKFYIQNHIIADDYYTFREAITKGIEGLFISLATSDNYKYRFKEFKNLTLRLIIFYVEEKKLEQLLNTYNIKRITIIDYDKDSFVKTIINFFSSQYSIEAFGNITFNKDISKQEYLSQFRQSLRHMLNRVMLLLSISDLDNENLEPVAQPFVHFLKVAKDIDHSNWPFILKFLESKIQIFSNEQIKAIIQLTFDQNQHYFGDDILDSLCTLTFAKTSYILDDSIFFRNLINFVTTPCSKCKRPHSATQLVACWSIADEEYKRIIKRTISEQLVQNFNPELYMRAAFKDILSKDEHVELLQNFITCTYNACSTFDIKLDKNRWKLMSYEGINYINCLAYMNVDFSQENIQAIATRSDYYNWLINPETYDYSTFDTEWLTSLCPYFLKNKLSNITELREKVKIELKCNYNKKLAEFYFHHLD